MFKPSSNVFSQPFQGGVSFVDNYYYLCFILSLLSFHACSLQPYAQRALICDAFLCFYHFHIWCLRSGVVLYCINSRSLPSSLLYLLLMFCLHLGDPLCKQHGYRSDITQCNFLRAHIVCFLKNLAISKREYMQQTYKMNNVFIA